MSAIARSAGVAAVLALTALTGAGMAMSEEGTVSFKPLAGVSLHLGSKHAIGYFQQTDGVCQLTLVVGEEPRGDEIPEVTPTRFSAAIEAGRTARFDTGERHAAAVQLCSQCHRDDGRDAAAGGLHRAAEISFRRILPSSRKGQEMISCPFRFRRRSCAGELLL